MIRSTLTGRSQLVQVQFMLTDATLLLSTCVFCSSLVEEVIAVVASLVEVEADACV